MEEKNLKVTILNFNVDWLEIKNACRQTVSMDESTVEPTPEWKKKLLICRHSPIRIGNILLKIENVPFYVMGHLVRHNVGVTPFVSTSREDRTGIPREEKKQTDLVDMQLLVNIEALMNISERRLCTCADKNTLMVWKEVLKAVREFDEEIYWACVPQCIAHGGCIEPFAKCRFYDNFSSSMLTDEGKTKVLTRYNTYNNYRK